MKAIFLSALGVALALAVGVRAEDRFEPPVPVRTSAPVFPYQLRRDGISGMVMVSCLIDEHGDVQDMKVEKASNQAFVDPAMDALRKWKFKPAERDGARVPIRVSIPIKFTVDD